MSILSNLLFYLVGMWLQKLILIRIQASCSYNISYKYRKSVST